MIHFSCPTCQKKLRAPDEMTGNKVRCPKCQQKLLVPPPVQSAAFNKTVLGKTREDGATPTPNWLGDVQEIERTPSPFAVASPPIPEFEKHAELPPAEAIPNRVNRGEQHQTPAPLPALFRVSCPHCLSPLQVEHRLLGQQVVCGKCRKPMLLAGPTDAMVQPDEQMGGQQLRRPSRKKRVAAALLIAILILLLGSAASLVFVVSLYQSTPSTSTAQEQASRRKSTAGEVDGDSLVRCLDDALKKLNAPTVNDFKRQKAQEQYQDTLNAYRGRPIRVSLRIRAVNAKTIAIEDLTTDPDYNLKIWGAIQRWRAGGPEPQLKAVIKIYLDFSGTDFCTSTYKETPQPLTRRCWGGAGLGWGNPSRSAWTFPYPCFSPDGRVVAAVGNPSMHLIEAESGRVLRRIAFAKDNRSTAAAISPDGRTLAVVSMASNIWRPGMEPGQMFKQTLTLWEIATGRERLIIPAQQGQQAQLNSVAFSPDGRLLAAGGLDHAIYLWDASTGKQVQRWEGHHGDIDSLAFAPDGRRLASASYDTTILIWDVPRLPNEKIRATPLTQKQLDAAWSDLASGDAAKAYKSMRLLQSGPEQAVPLLAERLRPTAPPDAERLKRLLEQLDSEEFAQRERATEALHKLGWAAEPTLRKALAGEPSLEARKRIQTLLDGLGERGLPMELVQLLRGIEVLEHANTPAARLLLRKLADSTLGEGLGQKEMSQEAKASLERMGK
jgi:hypothetical protein